MLRPDDVLVGSFMAEILVLPHHTPTIGGHETVSLAPDHSLDCDPDAIRVYGTKHPIELVGYLQHNHLCVLRDLLNSGFIRIEGYVPEIAPAELRGVNVPCRINVYSNENHFKEVKSAIARDGGMQLFLPVVDQNQEGVERSTAKKGKALGPDCGIFHNKEILDVWNYIQKNKLQRKNYVICDENLKKVFNGKPRVDISGLESLINFLVYNHKLVDAES